MFVYLSFTLVIELRISDDQNRKIYGFREIWLETWRNNSGVYLRTENIYMINKLNFDSKRGKHKHALSQFS